MQDNETMSFAGEKMTISEDADGTTTISFNDKGTGRSCGDCQLCCKLLPMPPLNKPAGTRCVHQKTGKGCRIYAGRPTACRLFACRWLADIDATGLPRPDRAHYVLDPAWDYITLAPHDGSAPTRVPVMQVWVDPAFRNAYKAPALRAFMARVAEKHRAATIVRWSSSEAMTVFPPSLVADGAWHEKRGMPEPEHGPGIDDVQVIRTEPHRSAIDG